MLVIYLKYKRYIILFLHLMDIIPLPMKGTYD
jgi:hypothetical protein